MHHYEASLRLCLCEVRFASHIHLIRVTSMADCLVVCLQQDNDGQNLQGKADLHVQPRCMGEGGGVGRFDRS